MFSKSVLISKSLFVAAIMIVGGSPSVAVGDGSEALAVHSAVSFSWGEKGKGNHPRHSKPYRSKRPYHGKWSKKYHGHGSHGGPHRLWE